MQSEPDLPSAESAPLPLVAIVGRPNAGKSTLFNRLTRSQKAQVDAAPGVTRDRNFAEARHRDRRFVVVDTGGLDLDAASGIEAEIRAQSEMAIDEADAIILLLDGRSGVAPSDSEVLERLRRSRKPFWVAVNKLDTPRLDDDAADFFALGVEEVVPISAAHGRGVAELLDAVLDRLEAPAVVSTPVCRGGVAVAIVGRPNVGKSSILNRLVGYSRSIVTPIAGTTRDAIDTPLAIDEHEYVLVDTAGIRRRPRVRQQLERGSVTRALRALERADVAVLVTDGTEGMTEQDARLAGYAWEKGRGLLLVVNKCDLLEDRKRFQKQLEGEIRRDYPFIDAVPVLFTSARSGGGLDQLLPLVDRVSANHRRELSTVVLNQVLHRATQQTAPPSERGRRPNFKYAVQTAVCPPTITFFCSHPEIVAESYSRFLINQLREEFPFTGTPVRMIYRASKDAKPARSRRPSAKSKSGTPGRRRARKR